MDHGLEARIGFVIAGRNPSERLDLGEVVFDQVTPAIHVDVVGYLDPSISLRRDDGQRPSVVQLPSDRIVVEGLVRDQCLDGDTVEQRVDADAVMTLAREQNEPGQVAERIDQGQDFGGQTATGTADGLSFSPPFAPVPC